GPEGDQRVHDLGAGDLLTLLESGDDWMERAHTAATAHSVAFASVQVLAPLRRPPKLLALAGNYQDHVRESKVADVQKANAVPLLFLKPSTSIIAAGEPVFAPDISDAVDYELELAVVIGRRCKHVTAAEAPGVVAGYMVANDISARVVDWGVARGEVTPRMAFFDWLNGKWPDSFAPMGPYIVTADEVPDPQHLAMRLSVNGIVRQNASTANMIFTVAETIAFCARFMTLEPGDVILTGTPSGVGATTQTYLQPGDRMEAWIEGLGTLVTPVVAAGDSP
ncbi:MAG: fumarylacetoacetate hydrolase family protein, partial [Chloroflexota bacterium]|nr:fumarylacetoacetate hydrolase family protein [Chloroflexota bacterium]